MTTNAVHVSGNCKLAIDYGCAVPTLAKRPAKIIVDAITENICANLMRRNLHDTEHTVDITGHNYGTYVLSADKDKMIYTVYYNATITFADSSCVTFFQLTSACANKRNNQV